MFNLIRKLFSTRDGARTVVFVNDDGSKPSSSHRLNPINLWFATLGTILAIVVIVVVLLRFTPMGGLVYDQENIRNSVISIQQRVAALQDTLQARNDELNEMQEIIRTGNDTELMSSSPVAEGNATADSGDQDDAMVDPLSSPQAQVQRLPADAVLINNLFREAPEFPAPFPIEGTTTRTFDTKNSHFGLDIAASDDATFKTIADGVIINQEWTFNYGYVIILQHAEGVLSVYKHAKTVDKATGETVRQGDILGTIGDVGMLSSGPHLHLEIWKSGIPQNPVNYLLKSE